MALTGRHNIAKMYSTTTGDGTLTLTTAVPLCNTFANAGVVDGETVTYVITDPGISGREVGRGVYTSSGTTLTRATVLSSTNGGSKISCSGRQTVAITLAAEDVQPFAAYYYNGGFNSVNDGVTASTLSIDTEWVDDFALASLSSNTVVIAKKGWYELNLSVYYQSATTAFDGRVKLIMGAWEASHGYTSAMDITTNQFWLTGLIEATTDAHVVGPVQLTNHSGVVVQAYVYELTVKKLGNK